MTPIHVAAGLVGIVSGAVALFALKGGARHRRSGMIFVYSMLVMSLTGALIAAVHATPNLATSLQGLLTFYLVVTGLLTVRRRTEGFQWIDLGAMLVALSIGICHVAFGVAASSSATGQLFGYPPALYFVFGPIALVAALGDVRMMRAGGFQGARRLARHLWRMCFALFIAVASFFLGQPQVFPEPLRNGGLRAIPVLIVLGTMAYWQIRVASGFSRKWSSAATPPSA